MKIYDIYFTETTTKKVERSTASKAIKPPITPTRYFGVVTQRDGKSFYNFLERHETIHIFNPEIKEYFYIQQEIPLD